MPAYAIETTVVGTMWKQEGTVVSPADDVTSVIGVGGGCAEGADCGFANISAGAILANTLTLGGAFTGSNAAVVIDRKKHY